MRFFGGGPEKGSDELHTGKAWNADSVGFGEARAGMLSTRMSGIQIDLYRAEKTLNSLHKIRQDLESNDGKGQFVCTDADGAEIARVVIWKRGSKYVWEKVSGTLQKTTDHANEQNLDYLVRELNEKGH